MSRSSECMYEVEISELEAVISPKFSSAYAGPVLGWPGLRDVSIFDQHTKVQYSTWTVSLIRHSTSQTSSSAALYIAAQAPQAVVRHRSDRPRDTAHVCFEYWLAGGCCAQFNRHGESSRANPDRRPICRFSGNTKQYCKDSQISGDEW